LREREIVCEDLSLGIDDLKRQGFRLDLIYPADDPQSAVLSHAGETVRVSTPGAPALPEGLPPFRPEFVLTRAGASPGQGRAGMLYRDLIPSRLGGRYIASHIAIPEGGPVADWVHYHRIVLQIIYVRTGWVRVVYEGEGEPFVMEAGDMVLQPPEIRHRVLESSPGLEVVEITAPALHATFADHELSLPGGVGGERPSLGQRFLRHVAAETPWTALGEVEAQDTGLGVATGGLAEARTIRPLAPAAEFAPHDGELVFGFVLDGSAELERDGRFPLGPADSFVIPPGEGWRVRAMSGDFRLLHVTTARLDAGARCPL
jgi:mannose-6-phosphate isomerase-like protein (cupin superfamily)